ncbi:MAG: hypothetical protein AAGD07_09335 [Planctomycetota bacterium]
MSNNKILVQLPPPQHKRAYRLMLGYAEQLREDGETVVLANCGVTGGSCEVNLTGSRLICRACQSDSESSALAMGLPLISLGTPEDLAEPPEMTLGVARVLLDGVRSCLVSVLRILTSDLRRIRILKRIVHKQLRTAAGVFAAGQRALESRQFRAVAVVNGRYACRRAALHAAVVAGTDFTTLDFNLFGKPMVFHGHTPHDRSAIQRRMLASPADHAVAKAYFDQRRCATFNKFARKHTQFAPPTTEGFDRRITFFLSSQDECESLGADWNSNFEDNAAVIHAAATAFPKTLLCVRFHPNQASILSDVVSDFDSLRELDNVVIFNPNDVINSYRLIDWSDVVVTFASTISVEACWQGRPVIQLGPSFYDQLGFSETPETLEDFLELLNHDLSAKPIEPVVRFANYEVTGFDEIAAMERTDSRRIIENAARTGSIATKAAKQANEIAQNGLKAWLKWRLQSRAAA